VRVVSLGYTYTIKHDYEPLEGSKIFPTLNVKKVRMMKSLFPISYFSIRVPLGCEIGGNSFFNQLLALFNKKLNHEGYAIGMQLLEDNKEPKVWLFFDKISSIIRKKEPETKSQDLFLQPPIVIPNKDKKLTYYYSFTEESFLDQSKIRNEPIVLIYTIQNSLSNLLLFLILFVSLILMLSLLLLPFQTIIPYRFLDTDYYLSLIGLFLSISIFYYQLFQSGYDLVRSKWLYCLFILFWITVLLNLSISIV
jgi:hypothetical protein